MPPELLITVPAELVIIVSMLSVFRLQKTNQKNPPGLYYWHLLVFPWRISTYVTATCHPAASTIKPTKLFTPKVICDLLHHQIIACQSASSDSCCLCRLKRPERKICLFLHRHGAASDCVSSTSLNSSHVWVFAPVMTAASVSLASWYLSANWARRPLLLGLTDSIMASVQHHVIRRQPPTIFACQQLSPSATPERVQPLSIGSRTDFIHKDAVSNFWLVILHLSKALAPSMVMTKRWDSILCCQTSGNVLQLSTYTTALVVAPCYFLRLRLSRLMDLQAEPPDSPTSCAPTGLGMLVQADTGLWITLVMWVFRLKTAGCISGGVFQVLLRQWNMILVVQLK